MIILTLLINILINFNIVFSTSKIQDFSSILIGGGLDEKNTEIWNTIINLAGGKNNSIFGVVAAASEDPCCDGESSYIYYEALLYKYGAKEVHYIPITENNTKLNNDPKIISLISTFTGIFFGGGDQLRIIRSFYNGDSFEKVSPALIAIKQSLINNKGVLIGTSAGTDCQTNNIMITGGISYTSLLYGSDINTLPYPAHTYDRLGGYTHGIGMFSHGLLDTHFENRGRHGRFLRLLADTYSHPTGNTIGFGIDENTALVIDVSNNNNNAKVIGQRGVVFFNINGATISELNDHWMISNVLVSHLTSGDSINLLNYSIIPTNYKTSLQNREQLDHAYSSNDIFASTSNDKTEPFQFNKVATSLFNSKDNYIISYTDEKHPQYIVNMTKLGNSLGVDGIDPITGLYWISYYNMGLNIYTSTK